jgi:hypothetical protein
MAAKTVVNRAGFPPPPQGVPNAGKIQEAGVAQLVEQRIRKAPGVYLTI